MPTSHKRLFKTSLVYAIGQVVSQALNFFLLPIYTNKLGAIEYGKYATISAFTGFISTFLILSIYSGLYRFYKEYSDNINDQKKIINTALNFAYLMSCFVIILLLLLGEKASKFIFNFERSYEILSIVIITSIVSQISCIYTSKYTLEYKALKVSIINVIKFLLQFVIIVFLVAYKKIGLMGVLYGQLIANGIIYIYLVLVEIKNYKIQMSSHMLKNMLIYSVGLLPVNVSGWILQLSDRYFLSHYRGFESAGIYNLGYQFGMLINPIFITPFLGSFNVYVLETYKNSNAKENFKKLMRQYNIIGCFIMLGISIFTKSGIYILANKSFASAYVVVPLVVYSYFLYGKVSYYALGLQLKNKTYIEGFYMLISALINIILNFLIVPRLGMIGAAISTVISYLILNFILIKSSKKHYDLDLDFKYTISIQIITLGFYIIYFVYSKLNINILLEILFNCILLLIYIYVLVKFNIVNYTELVSKVKSCLLRKGFIKHEQ